MKPGNFPYTTSIVIKNAKTRNLKGIDIEFPTNSITVITGPSGSGKSSLAFHTLFRFNSLAFREVLDEYAAGGSLHYVPVADSVTPVMATVGVSQFPKKIRHDFTIGEFTGFDRIVGKFFATEGKLVCVGCNHPVKSYLPSEVCEEIFKLPVGTRFYILSNIGKVPRTKLSSVLQGLLKKGFVRAFVDGRLYELYTLENIPRKHMHSVSVVIDRLMADVRYASRIEESVEIAYRESPTGVAKVVTTDGASFSFSNRFICMNCGKEYPHLDFELVVKYLKSSHQKQEKGKLRLEWNSTDIKNIYNRPFHEIYELFKDYDSNNSVTKDLASSIVKCCKYMIDFGIGYLTPAKVLKNVSSGEFQKLRLARLLVVNFTGVLMIFDEPSRFLDTSYVDFFCSCLKGLCKRENTIIVVDNNSKIIRNADFVVEMGPGIGPNGGEVIWQGKPEKYIERLQRDSKTTQSIGKRKKSNTDNFIIVEGISLNNLKNVSVKIPMSSLTLITGPVGSGKTSLAGVLFNVVKDGEGHECVAGDIQIPEGLTKAFYVSEFAVVGSGRSSVATLMNVLSPIRGFFAKLPASRRKGYSAEYFSYTSKKAQCPLCKGYGILGYSTSKVFEATTCNACGGKRYSSEVAKIKYKGYSIADLMDFTVTRIAEIFSFLPAVKNRLKVLIDFGLGHIRFGQPVMTLSGGEARLLMIARYLSLLSSYMTEKALFIFDNPFSGLCQRGIDRLCMAWSDLVRKGHTVVVCDVKRDIASICDWLIVLGPGSGPSGGELLSQGEPKNADICLKISG